MAKNVVSTSAGKIWLGDDGILRQEFNIDTELTLQDAEESIATFARLSEGRPALVLVHMQGMKSATREARQYFEKTIAPPSYSAVAGLTSSAVNRVIGSFFLRFNKPNSPLRLFSSETEALKWLKGFL